MNHVPDEQRPNIWDDDDAYKHPSEDEPPEDIEQREKQQDNNYIRRWYGNVNTD